MGDSRNLANRPWDIHRGFRRPSSGSALPHDFGQLARTRILPLTLSRRFTFFCSLAPILLFPVRIPWISDSLILILIWVVSGTRYFLYGVAIDELLNLPNFISASTQFPNLIVQSRLLANSFAIQFINPVPPSPLAQIASIVVLPFFIYGLFLYYRALYRQLKKFIHLIRYLRWISKTYHARL